MSQTQQETYHVLFKNAPQKFYQAVRMFSIMKQFAKAKEQKKKQEETLEEEWNKFKQLREQLGLTDSPELEQKFKQLSSQQRAELIRDCEKKVLMQAGEKEYDFLLSTNKMLAEPQIINKEINLEQLKNMLTEYGLQFHIKELPDQTKELHFYAKDANLAARAISRTVDTILEDPETITKPTLSSLIQQAKEQVKEKEQALKQKEEKTQVLVGEKGTSIGKEGVYQTSEAAKEALDALSLFDNMKDGIEL
ncbi:hypothetical protein P0E66_13060 [Enterococcus faecalis]|uniref:hypothetical protein n=1 Tax=Enterococcus faecalis TaxID=1351 RepID=UPI0025B1C60E|nr:hypothetical protein [Enterococcus faecalis]MDN3202055.1 hypothetical protein [Enterococcus faecalis]